MINHLLASSAIASLAFAVPANAQAAAPPAAADSAGIGTIVVTPQRREESQQNAAKAIDTVSADNLNNRGVTSASKMTKLVPAISIPVATNSIASIFIRGVGNATAGAVNAIPARPEVGRTSVGVNFGYGNYDALEVDGFVNVATSDNSALQANGVRLSGEL